MTMLRVLNGMNACIVQWKGNVMYVISLKCYFPIGYQACQERNMMRHIIFESIDAQFFVALSPRFLTIF